MAISHRQQLLAALVVICACLMAGTGPGVLGAHASEIPDKLIASRLEAAFEATHLAYSKMDFQMASSGLSKKTNYTKVVAYCGARGNAGLKRCKQCLAVFREITKGLNQLTAFLKSANFKEIEALCKANGGQYCANVKLICKPTKVLLQHLYLFYSNYATRFYHHCCAGSCPQKAALKKAIDAFKKVALAKCV